MFLVFCRCTYNLPQREIHSRLSTLCVFPKQRLNSDSNNLVCLEGGESHREREWARERGALTSPWEQRKHSVPSPPGAHHKNVWIGLDSLHCTPLLCELLHVSTGQSLFKCCSCQILIVMLETKCKLERRKGKNSLHCDNSQALAYLLCWLVVSSPTLRPRVKEKLLPSFYYKDKWKQKKKKNQQIEITCRFDQIKHSQWQTRSHGDIVAVCWLVICLIKRTIWPPDFPGVQIRVSQCQWKLYDLGLCRFLIILLKLFGAMVKW